MSFLGNRTQRVHPLYVPIANKWSYWTYTARRNINWISMIALVLLVYSLVGAVLDIMDLVSGSVWNRVLYIAAFALSAIIKVLDLAAHYEDRFTTEERDEGFYENVEAPARSGRGWICAWAAKGQSLYSAAIRWTSCCAATVPWISCGTGITRNGSITTSAGRKTGKIPTENSCVTITGRPCTAASSFITRSSTACAVSRIRHIPKNP